MSIFNNALKDSVTDSTDIAFDFVNEIVNSSFETEGPFWQSCKQEHARKMDREVSVADCKQYQ